MNGREVADNISRARPDMKVLHISGHTLEKLISENGIMPGAEFLAKPFPASTFVRKVRAMLEDRADAAR